MTTLPRLKARTKITYPARVEGADGISVTKSNGVLTIRPDYGSIAPNQFLAGPTAGDESDAGFRFIVQADMPEITATDSTTGRSLADRFSDVVNVKDFGAVGDGTTDDTAAIQAALDNGGFTVYFPAGTYKVSAKLTVDGPRSIVGAGMLATRLQWTSAATTTGIEISPSADWYTSEVSRMALETFKVASGTAITFDYSGLIDGGVILPRAASHAKVHQVFIRGATDYTTDGWLNGIDFISCLSCTVESSRINGVYTGGYGTTPDSEKAIKFGGSGSPTSLVVNSTWCSAWQDAVYTEDAEGIYLSNFEFVTVSCGIRTNNAVAESGIETNNGHIATLSKGVDLSNMKDGKISGIVFYNLADVADVTCVTIGTGTGNIEVSGNMFRRLGAVTNMVGVLVSGGTENYIGTNLYDVGSSAKAIQIDSGATSTRVAKQVYISASTAPIINNSTSSVFEEFGNYAGDLDDIVTSVEWASQTHTLTSGVTNAPSGMGSTAGSVVKTMSYASNTAIQQLISPAIDRIYVRRKSSGSWSSWVYSLLTSDGLPSNAALKAISGVEPAADKLAYFDSTTTAALADISSYGRSLIDDADAATARGTLGLGTIATQAANNVAITGGSVSGITDIAIADGGTGASTARAAAANLGAAYILAQSAVAVSHTGDTTETTLATISIPANSMGANGRVRITTEWSYTNSVNNKSIRVKFGGTNYTSIAVTTSASTRVYTVVSNVNATNSQKGVGSGSTGWAITSSTPVTTSVDTTSDVSLTITGQLASSGETITLESYVVELLYGA